MVIEMLPSHFQFERQKKLEREHKKKQEALTLEETKEQIVQLEQKLGNYKTEKHELFHTLKKVLYEDETRRRSKEVPHVPHPTLYMQPTVRPGVYLQHKHPQLLVQQQPPPQQAVKRPRSPSPVRTSGIPPAYYRNAPQGHSSAKFAATTSYATPTTAHGSHYTSYPGSAVGSVGGHLVREQEEAARAKQIYLAPSAQPPPRSVYSERAVAAAIQQRSLPPAAHSSVPPPASSQGFRSGSIMTGYPRYMPPNTTTGGSISSPRIAHSTQANGTSSGRY